jgi:undecaprenyl-diphosphatase
MTWLQSVILAIVEGLTEFLPVSSTGHMALTASAMGIEKEPLTKLFIESIQFGAIISVIILYWRKFFDFKKLNLYLKLLIAFIPAAIVGVLLKKHIDQMLEKPLFIAIVTLIGGIILLFVDNWFKRPSVDNVDDVTPKKSFFIGLFQVLAIIFPGLSRSAATIVGGMQQKLSRRAAAEFSFFLAVPTLAGAFAKSMWDAWKDTPDLMTHHNLQILAVGNLVAFIVAIIAIRAFISFLTKFGFKLFGYYRIVLGLTIIIMLLLRVNINLS